MEVKFRNLRAEEIDLRVGKVVDKTNFSGVVLLLYKNARVDQDILDETVGAMNWQRSHSRDNANCSVGIWDKDKNQWVWKEDTGTESNTEAEKGLASDSFKRACVNWGIGRELYSAKNILVACELEGKKVKPGIDWYVKEIEYDDNIITKLIIHEKTKSSDKEVYCYYNRLNKPKTPSKTEEENMTDKQIEITEMTLEEAENLSAIMKNGIERKFKDLTDEQLNVIKAGSVNKTWLKAVDLILESRKNNKENLNND